MKQINHFPVWLFFIGLGILCSPAYLHATLHRLGTNQQYITNGAQFAPGDTICLEPGRRELQHFKHLHGTAEQPILITNCPEGQVLIGTEHYYGFTLDSVSHVRISGTGSDDHEFGIWVDGTSAGMGLGVGGLSHHVEIDHLRISDVSFAGIMVKQDFGGNPPEPWPVFDGLYIHHNWIHDVGGEGMYLGETKSPGMIFKNVDVSYNLIQRTGWDLMQIANMTENIEIHHNIMLDGGLEQENFHQNGFQVGDNTGDLRFHHNIIKRVVSNLLILMGGGTTRIDSNYFEFTTGERALFMDHRSFVDTNSTILLEDNFFVAPEVNEYWRVYNDLNQVIFRNNKLQTGPDTIAYSGGAGSENVLLENNDFGNFPKLMFLDTAAGATAGHNGQNFNVVSEYYSGMGFGFVTEQSTSILMPGTDYSGLGNEASTPMRLWIHKNQIPPSETQNFRWFDAKGQLVQ